MGAREARTRLLRCEVGAAAGQQQEVEESEDGGEGAGVPLASTQ
jgi:hypothetical protein